MSLLFNMLSRSVITVLPKSKHLLISWLQSPSAVVFKLQLIYNIVLVSVVQQNDWAMHVSAVWSVCQPRLILCDSMDYSPPGSSVHGISQARILEWAAIFSSRGSSRPRDKACVSCMSCASRWILYHWTMGESFNIYVCGCVCVDTYSVSGSFPLQVIIRY